MTRDEIQQKILLVFEEKFEFVNPGLDDHLRDVHGFDSIDAIELMGEIEKITNCTLTREEKERAMEIRTINDILDFVESLLAARRQ